MDFLDKKLGPFRVRGWGLALNMIANAIALYGLSQVLQTNTGYFYLGFGGALTIICIAVLATPARDE